MVLLIINQTYLRGSMYQHWSASVWQSCRCFRSPSAVHPVSTRGNISNPCGVSFSWRERWADTSDDPLWRNVYFFYFCFTRRVKRFEVRFVPFHRAGYRLNQPKEKPRNRDIDPLLYPRIVSLLPDPRFNFPLRYHKFRSWDRSHRSLHFSVSIQLCFPCR